MNKHDSIDKKINVSYGTQTNSDNRRYSINWKTKYSKVSIIKYH